MNTEAPVSDARIQPDGRNEVALGLDRYAPAELVWETRQDKVYRACLKDQHLWMLVSVPQAWRRNGHDAAWLRRDCQIAEALRSSCVAKVFSVEATELGPALVHVDEGARPLETLAPQSRDIGAVLAIGCALAQAVADLHQEGLVHTNLNTGTVWYHAATGEVRITGFSCARYAPASAVPDMSDRLTDIRFVAPEQTGRIHQRTDQRSDIYAIGIILFRLLAGRLPFDGTDPLRIADDHLTATPVFPADALAALPAPLVTLVLKCLAKNPEGRYFSASGLAYDLLECQAQWRAKAGIAEFELGARDAKARFRLPTTLFGRDAETRVLRNFIRQGREGRSAILLVTGSPGVGKSAFLNQLSDLTARENGRFVSGKFDQYKRNVPYFSLAQACQQLVHQLLTEPAQQVALWKQRVLAAVEDSGQVVIDVVPELALIIGAQPVAPELPPAEARNRFNRIFTNVVQAFARPESPLCLFMDDLQWVDSASLELLAHILADPRTSNLLFVGAYRDRDVGQSHRLKVAMRALAKAGVDVQSIHLGALQLVDVRQLLEATLSQSAEEALPLADLLHSRSQGNPLYLTQLLHFLHDAQLVWFDYASGRWRWDPQRIQTEAVTEDILDLLSLRIRGLPASARDLLSVAACLGSTFESETLAIAAEQPCIEEALAVCVRADLLVPVTEISRDAIAAPLPDVRRFRFLHDRIQQAAFDLIPDDRKKAFRLAIGLRLLGRLTAAEQAVPQIDVLNNLNYAWELIGAPRERVARLNLVAGRKARDALAYHEALRYLSVGLNLLDRHAWENTYELAFDLHANAMECEYLQGAFERADELFALLLENSRSVGDKAKIYLTKILLDTCEERYEEAVEIGIQALQLFGIGYRRHPRGIHLAVELVAAHLRMRRRKPRDLLRHRALTDPEKLAALKILVALFPTAYFLSPHLLMLSGLKVVNYSLRYGVSPLSAGGFVLHGLGLGAALNRHKAGYEFGQFAVELAERGEDSAVLCKALVIFSQFIKFWCDPIDSCFPLIEQARKLALQAGDHQYVNYAIIGGISLRFSRGMNLPEFLAHCDHHELFVTQSKDAFATESFLMWKNMGLALTGKTAAATSLDNASYDEKAAEERYRKTRNLTLLSYQYTLRLQLLYLFGRYDEAFEISTAGEAVVASAPGYITVADHYLYRGLAAAGSLIASRVKDHGRRKAMRHCLKKLKLFAANAPQNFQQQAILMEAECARASGEKGKALELYNRAIDLAEERGYPQLVGLANERAAICCIADGQRRLASWYLNNARAAYGQWGAVAKIAALEREFAGMLDAAAVVPNVAEQRATGDGAVRRAGEAFDVVAAAASQMMAGDEKRDDALANLLQVIRIQTGAEAAYLIGSRGGVYRVEAGVSAAGSPVPAETADSKEDDRFSLSIVNYVVHTGNDLVADEPHLDPRFARCEYLAREKPKSVMCAAIVKQSELLGVMYLEHGRMAHAFDQQRLGWLRILATELGLMVWGDKLSRYKEYLHRFAPAVATKEIDADPHSPDLSARERDISIMFADLAGYTRLYEQMERHAADSLINRAFSEFTQEIHDFDGVLLDVRGDELFVLFADEDPARHARNAAEAALAINRTVTRLNAHRSASEPALIINIGINSGPASVGLQPIEFATGSRWRYDATGSTVNVGARVRELARDGNILLSGATAERLVGDFACEDLGDHSVKNVSAPVRIFRLQNRITARH